MVEEKRSGDRREGYEQFVNTAKAMIEVVAENTISNYEIIENNKEVKESANIAINLNKENQKSLRLFTTLSSIDAVASIILVIIVSILLVRQGSAATQPQVQAQILSANRADCIREIQSQYFFDFSNIFTINPIDQQATRNFSVKLQADALAFKNAGDTCTKQLTKNVR